MFRDPRGLRNIQPAVCVISSKFFIYAVIRNLMIRRNLARRISASMMIGLLGLSTVVRAAPVDYLTFFQQQQQQHHPLPPVNWVRSRKIDQKHISLDLRFDWDKEQAYGTDTITLAPFADSDHVQL